MATRRERVVVEADVNPFVRGMTTASAAAKRFANDLDATDSRMSNIVQTGLALGPALVPVGAVAVPAIAALTAGLGAAVLAGSAAMLAFNGVGDSLGALSAYRLDPTAENLAKVKEELQQLPASGREFVLFLDDLRPQLDSLQKAAADGMLPGVQEGITDLLDRLPEVRSVISNISEVTGELFADAGADMASPRWDAAFDYLQSDAPQILDTLSRSFGNLAAAGANTLVALDPLSDWSAEGLLGMTRDLRAWTEGLPSNEGFQEFMAYVQQVGPQVGDTLAALGNALVSIIEAAAPIGPVALQGIEALANAISAIASSQAGPALLAIAAGLSAVSRAVTLARAANASALVTMLGGIRKDGAAAGSSATKAAGGITAIGNSAGKAKIALRGLGAGVGMFAVSMTDIDDKVGLSNTAMLGMMGTIGGPWGAAVGTAAGLALDFAAANDELEASGRAVRAAFEDVTAFEQQNQLLDDYATKISDTKASAAGWEIGLGAVGLDPLGGFLGDKLAGDAEKAQEEYDELTAAQERNKQALSDLGNVMSSAPGYDDYTGNISKLTQIASDAQPVLDEMGITLQDVTSLNTLGGPAWTDFIASFKATRTEMDSIAGRTTTVGEAMKGLDNQILSTAESSDMLQSALDDLLDPALNAEAAMDSYKTALRGLSEELKGGADFKGFDAGSIANKQLTRDVVTGLKEVLVTQARAGAGSQKLASQISNARQQFIQEGMAAGFSRKEITARADAIGLTPKLVSTVFRMLGIDKAQVQARDLAASYNKLPKALRTEIATNGMPKTKADVAELAKRYKLTPKEVRTLIRARDEATGPIKKATATANNFGRQKPQATLRAQDSATAVVRGATRALSIFGNQRPTPTLSARDAATGIIRQAQGVLNVFDGSSGSTTLNAQDNASGTISSVRSSLAAIPRSVTTIINTIRTVTGNNAAGGVWDENTMAFAAGGDIPNGHMPELAGPGLTRVWREPETKGEAYIPLADDWRRPRAVDIWAQTGRLLGQRFETFAEGGMSDAEERRREYRRKQREKAEAEAEAREEAAREARREALSDFQSSRSALRGFNVRGRDSASETRSEMRDLTGALIDAYGRDAKWVKHIDGLGDKLVAAQKAQDKAAAELSRNTEQLKGLRSARRDLSRDVADSFDNEIAEGGLQASLLQMRADENDSRRFERTLRRGSRLGLSGGAFRFLATSGNADLARQLNTRREVARFERQYLQTQRAQRSLGEFAGNRIYGRRINEQTREVRRMGNNVERMTRRLERLETTIDNRSLRGIERAVRQGAESGTDGREHRNRTRRRARR